MATLCVRIDRDGRTGRCGVGVALVSVVALIVAALAGHPWQVDAHMYFYAALAMLAAYCDWRVVVLGAGAVALHHLVLNFLLPEAVYPGGAQISRVILHAVVVLAETAALVWLTHQLAVLFARVHDAAAAAEDGTR